MGRVKGESLLLQWFRSSSVQVAVCHPQPMETQSALLGALAVQQWHQEMLPGESPVPDCFLLSVP